MILFKKGELNRLSRYQNLKLKTKNNFISVCEDFLDILVDFHASLLMDVVIHVSNINLNIFMKIDFIISHLRIMFICKTRMTTSTSSEAQKLWINIRKK